VILSSLASPLFANRAARTDWDVKSADWQRFAEYTEAKLRPLLSAFEQKSHALTLADAETVRQAAIDEMCAMWTDMLLAAASESLQRRTSRIARGEWWRAPDVRAAHNRLTAAARRRRRAPQKAGVDDALAAARREFRAVARDAKQRAWDLSAPAWKRSTAGKFGTSLSALNHRH
jgi:hypothetical protein